MALNGEEIVTIVSIAATVGIAFLTYLDSKERGSNIRTTIEVAQQPVNQMLENARGESKVITTLLRTFIETQAEHSQAMTQELASLGRTMEVVRDRLGT